MLFRSKDLSGREIASFIPLLVFIVWIGVHPNTFLSKTESSVKKIIDNFHSNSKKLGLEKELEMKLSEKK